MPISTREKQPPRISIELTAYLGRQCYYCVTVMQATPEDRPTKDHVVPWAHGGSRGDVVICCWGCNRMSRNIGYEAFLRRCRAIAARHP